MKRHFVATILILLAFLNTSNLLSEMQKNEGAVLGIADAAENGELAFIDTHENFELKLKTETAFDQKEEKVYEPIPYPTKYVDDKEMEYGTEKVLEEGKDGTKILTYKITFWIDEEIDRQLVDTEIEEPKTEVVAKGKKIVWREHMTPDVGGVKYWQKIKVWATKYDANCIGCTGRTYSGTEVKKGTCAVDPKVIKLGTNFYVDGYGLCRAEDIGGAIKGNKIDLGFEDASKGNWGAAWTYVYLLTSVPED